VKNFKTFFPPMFFSLDYFKYDTYPLRLYSFFCSNRISYFVNKRKRGFRYPCPFLGGQESSVQHKKNHISLNLN